MLGWEEIPITFRVKEYDHSDIGKNKGWHLILKNPNIEGAAGHIVQRWDHLPSDLEVDAAIFAVKQGITFITSYLACFSPKRRVEITMPRIRIKIVDEGVIERIS